MAKTVGSPVAMATEVPGGLGAVGTTAGVPHGKGGILPLEENTFPPQVPPLRYRRDEPGVDKSVTHAQDHP